MMNLFEILNFLIVSVFVGFVSAQIAKAIDFAMDYGHIFSKVRHFKAIKAARRINRFEFYYQEFMKRTKMNNFSERLNAVDDLYWQIASDDPSFTLWLCKVCISHRITALFSILTAFFYLTANDIHFAAFFVLYLIAFAVNQYFITND